jgi:hypothetical protein
MKHDRRILLLFIVVLLMAALAAPVSAQRTWKPISREQTDFLSSSAFEVLFGGAAGPGKTECGVMEALRQIRNSLYTGVIFRRSYQMLEDAHGPISRSKLWYPAYGGSYNISRHEWTFPSGAQIFFRYLESDNDLDNYQGAQYAYIFFDELTQFTLRQYLYLFSRCRVDVGSGLRAYIRAASNPTGAGKYWVKKRFNTQAIANKIAYFTRLDDVDTRVEKGHPDATSRSFIPATYRSNPKISPEYIAGLKQLGPVEQAQFLDGDWDIEDTAGRVYPNWSSVYNVTEEAEYKPDLPLRWGVDDGYAEGQGIGTESHHPRVILLGQLTPLGGLDIFAEYYKTQESDYLKSIQTVLDWGYPPPEVAYIDSSAAMFKANLWNKNITTFGATHPVGEGIKNLRRLICDAQGVRLLRVHPRCQNLIRELAAYQQDPHARFDNGEPKPIKIDDHGPDTLRYMTWNLRYKDPSNA